MSFDVNARDNIAIWSEKQSYVNGRRQDSFQGRAAEARKYALKLTFKPFRTNFSDRRGVFRVEEYLILLISGPSH
jgi:hypothetical protein